MISTNPHPKFSMGKVEATSDVLALTCLNFKPIDFDGFKIFTYQQLDVAIPNT